MTNPIDPTPESHESAAQYRVNAQELSHVVQILQARKEAEARQRANTVALGDAVEQLGLEMTPEELLAEIRADRARRAGSASRPKRQNSAQRRTFATFAVCTGLAAMMASSIHMHRLNRQAWENRNSPLYLPREFATVDVSTMPATEGAMPMAVTVETTQAAAPAQTVSAFTPLSRFGENDKVDCEFTSLRDLAGGKSQEHVLVQANGSGGTEDREKLWTLIKQQGEVMVYAYGPVEEIAKAMNGYPAHVYASQHGRMKEQLLPLHLFKGAEQVDIPGASGAMLAGSGQEVSSGQKVRLRVRAAGSDSDPFAGYDRPMRIEMKDN